MANFFTRLVTRTLGLGSLDQPDIQPLVASMFAPGLADQVTLSERSPTEFTGDSPTSDQPNLIASAPETIAPDPLSSISSLLRQQDSAFPAPLPIPLSQLSASQSLNAESGNRSALTAAFTASPPPVSPSLLGEAIDPSVFTVLPISEGNGNPDLPLRQLINPSASVPITPLEDSTIVSELSSSPLTSPIADRSDTLRSPVSESATPAETIQRLIDPTAPLPLSSDRPLPLAHLQPEATPATEPVFPPEIAPSSPNSLPTRSQNFPEQPVSASNLGMIEPAATDFLAAIAPSEAIGAEISSPQSNVNSAGNIPLSRLGAQVQRSQVPLPNQITPIDIAGEPDAIAPTLRESSPQTMASDPSEPTALPTAFQETSLTNATDTAPPRAPLPPTSPQVIVPLPPSEGRIEPAATDVLAAIAPSEAIGAEISSPQLNADSAGNTPLSRLGAQVQRSQVPLPNQITPIDIAEEPGQPHQNALIGGSPDWFQPNSATSSLPRKDAPLPASSLPPHYQNPLIPFQGTDAPLPANSLPLSQPPAAIDPLARHSSPQETIQRRVNPQSVLPESTVPSSVEPTAVGAPSLADPRSPTGQSVRPDLTSNTPLPTLPLVPVDPPTPVLKFPDGRETPQNPKVQPLITSITDAIVPHRRSDRADAIAPTLRESSPQTMASDRSEPTALPTSFQETSPTNATHTAPPHAPLPPTSPQLIVPLPSSERDRAVPPSQSGSGLRVPAATAFPVISPATIAVSQVGASIPLLAPAELPTLPSATITRHSAQLSETLSASSFSPSRSLSPTLAQLNSDNPPERQPEPQAEQQLRRSVAQSRRPASLSQRFFLSTASQIEPLRQSRPAGRVEMSPPTIVPTPMNEPPSSRLVDQKEPITQPRSLSLSSPASPLNTSPPATIQVTIGRVEVRGVPPAVPSRARSTQAKPALSLDHYLKQRGS